MNDSIKRAIWTVQQVFAEHPTLQSIQRVDSLQALELTTVSNGLEGLQLVDELVLGYPHNPIRTKGITIYGDRECIPNNRQCTT